MRSKIQITPVFWISGALALLTVPLNWLGSILAAAAFHEICHLVMIRLCRIRVRQMKLDVRGAVIEMDPAERGKELLCALAGPAGGLLLLLLLPRFPRLALCGLVQSLFNLLPIYPMDGGRALQCTTEMLFPVEIADRICKAVRIAVCVTVIVLSAYMLFLLQRG